MTLLSALGGGLWLIPLGLFLASLWSFYKAYKQHQSGSVWYDDKGQQHESKDKIVYIKIGAFWFGVAFFVFAIGSLIWMYLER